MVLITRNTNLDETMPQTVPSAGFTPPCDYTNFAENFDLSLLPGGEEPTYNQFYQTPTQSLLLTTITSVETTNKQQNPKIFTSFYNQNNNSTTPTELSLDFEAELSPKKYENIFFQSNNNNNLLDISVNGNLLSPSSDQFGQYRQSNEAYFYPSSPELSLYTSSPNSSIYSQSPRDDLYANQLDIKQENFLPSSPGPASPATSCSSGRCSSFDKITIKEEITTDFTNLINPTYPTSNLRNLLNTPPSQERPCGSPKDHQLLREALRDTSFQKKFNIKPFDFEFVSDFKMKEPDDNVQNDLMRENIEPVFNMAIEQMKKDIVSTCTALGISPDPHRWNCSNVLAWLQWTSRQFDLIDPIPEQWDMNGTTLLTLSEDDFVKRAPQGGMMLYAQLEIWKAAYSEDDLNPQWVTETTSSNASSGDISEDDDDESNSSQIEPPNRPSTSSRSGTNNSSTHIHLWQFLKELLQQSQTYGSCIRWLDRTKGIFKIEDSVKVARLWGKRKNRPAMNYDKLSRSIRQYYKKGIMKKTERSQRLVYQFCHPYNL